MCARWAVSALAIASAVASGCGPKVKPGLGVVGEKTVAKFDRPMVATDKLGQDVADTPVRIKPVVPGKFRWLDARTLAFVAEEALPRSTHFELEARAGTTALDGFGLAKAVQWSFETERLHVTLGSPGRWATPDQRIAGLVQPAGPAVRRGEAVRLRVRREPRRGCRRQHGRDEDARASFAVLPHEPLALATKWRFECSAELTGAEGPLGLEIETKKVEARAGSDAPATTTAPANQIAFETYGPLKVTSVQAAGRRDLARRDVDCPDVLEPAGRHARRAADQDRSRPSRASPSAPPSSTITSATRCARSTRTRTTRSRSTPRSPTGSASGWTARTSPTSAPATARPAWTSRPARGWSRRRGRVSGVGAQPHHAGSRRHRGPRGEARRARRPARLVGRGAVRPSKKVGLKTKHVAIPINGRKNQWNQIADRAGEAARRIVLAAPGFYYLALRAPEEPHPGVGQIRPARELLLNFTNLGVTAKLAGPSGLVWVTRLSDGQPQPGAEVSIRDAKGKVRWHGTTDADGAGGDAGSRRSCCPRTSAPQRNRAGRRRAMATANGEGEGGDGFEGEGDFGGPRAADAAGVRAARQGHTWVNPARTGGLAAWNFHVTDRQSPRAEQLRGFLHTDRGLYRPGDTVRLKRPGAHDEAGIAAARAGGAQGARHRARSARRADAREERRPVAASAASRSTSRSARGRAWATTASRPRWAKAASHERFSVEQYRPPASR